VTPDYTGELEIDICQSPNFGERKGGRKVDMLLLHYTGMESADGALSWLCNPDSHVRAHYIVFEDGRIIQMVPEFNRAWHAGKSFWAGDSDINSRSIGIEIANPGHACGSPDFPDMQMDVVVDLCRDIVLRHEILPARVLAHSDVAPGRKQDPGEKFDWARLAREGVGLWPEIDQQSGKDIVLKPGDTGDAVADMQTRFSAFGYGIQVSGQFDRQTETIVRAFHLHFCPGQNGSVFNAVSDAVLGRILALTNTV
jgi:N-acetylmuramoyl-L-alanine amidase